MGKVRTDKYTNTDTSADTKTNTNINLNWILLTRHLVDAIYPV